MNGKLFWLGLAVMTLGAAGCCTRSSGNARPITLFNGKDFTGWKTTLADPAVKLEQVWSVKDGVIVCKGEPMGYLYTEQAFTNYRLEVEYRWAPGQTPGNSGIFGRINGEPRPLPRCIETQLKHGNAGDLYGFHGLKIGGDPARFKAIPGHAIGGDLTGVSRITGNEQPAGQWNKVVILAQGPNLTVWFNGQKVNEARDAEVIAGPVGLQSEGGEVHFRNVRITPLD